MVQYNFKNAFFRLPIGLWQEAGSVGASLVLNALPEGEFMSFNNIMRNLRDNKDNNLIRNEKDLEYYLDVCIKHKMVAEVHSEVLFRLFRDKLK